MIKFRKGEVAISLPVMIIIVLVTLLISLFFLQTTAQEAPEDELREATNFLDSQKLASDSRDSTKGINTDVLREAIEIYNKDNPSTPVDENDIYSVDALSEQEFSSDRVILSSKEAIEARYSGTDIGSELDEFIGDDTVVQEFVSLYSIPIKIVFEDNRPPYEVTYVRWTMNTESQDPISVAFVVDKSLAQSALEEITSLREMEILLDDPLIAFDIPKKEVEEESITIEYYIEGNIVENIEKIDPVVVERTNEPSSSSSGNQISEPRENQGGIAMLIVIVMLLLILVIYVQYQHHHRN